MIIFYGEGRLGNQLFQYQALNRIARKHETIYAIGLEDIDRVFDLQGANVVVLFNSLFVKRLFKFVLIPLLLYPSSALLRVFSYACEPVSGTPAHRGSSGEMRLTRGLLSGITFVRGGYYQNPSLWTSIFSPGILQLRSSLRTQAAQYLSENVPANAVPFFVHIRRGDYQGYSSYGLRDLMLPEPFYRRAIDDIKSRFTNAHFVFVTDDMQWVSDVFSDIQNKCIASFNARFDFALMASCRGGILSNSTYSLGAALLIVNPELIVAPQYWFGFRVNAWYPPRIEVRHQRVAYIPVLEHSA